MISELLPGKQRHSTLINNENVEEKRRLSDIEIQIADLERGSRYVNANDVGIALSEMRMRLDNLDALSDQENNKSKREDVKRRVGHLKSAHRQIEQTFSNYLKRKGTQLFDHNKHTLLQGSRSLEDAQLADVEIAESRSLDRSMNLIGSYIATGRATLEELTSQRERLKGAHRKVLDILNSLGLSGSILRQIENREVFDRLLVFGGMAVVSLLLLLLWWFVL